MKMLSRRLALLVPLVLAALPACSDEGVAPPPSGPEPVRYSAQIQPIFDARCVTCHTPSGQAPFLILDASQSYSSLVGVAATLYPGSQRVVAGDAGASVLYNKIADTGAFGGIMPPSGTSLTDAQVGLIRDWIDQGALAE